MMNFDDQIRQVTQVLQDLQVEKKGLPDKLRAASREGDTEAVWAIRKRVADMPFLITKAEVDRLKLLKAKSEAEAVELQPQAEEAYKVKQARQAELDIAQAHYQEAEDKHYHLQRRVDGARDYADRLQRQIEDKLMSMEVSR